ncbi:MAG: hypothetical protein M3680_30050 [Myxococcota bacterium]|nr:hypothetical protein [Myxococcota bacterium]
MMNRLRLASFVTWLVVWFTIAEARAWWYVEHAEIGTHAYRRACERVKAQVPESDDPHARRVRERHEIACGNLAIIAEIYGQTNALAGDRLDDPDDFLERGGDWKVGSKRHYYELQLADSHHFHPASLREWLRYHREAVNRAAAAAKLQGLDAVEAFQGAFYRNGFADHFLQDSYCAGHMGFNRSASSIAATSAHHNHWNRRGRRVRNRAGASWITYGDSDLNAPKNADGREHVIRAAAASAYGLVVTFVLGTRDHDHELAIWRDLPYLIDGQRVRGLIETGDDDEDTSELRPLEAINSPAFVDGVMDVSLTALAPFREPRQASLAMLVGFDVVLPVISTQAHLSAGAVTPKAAVDVRFAAQLELRRTLWLSFDGLLSHHASVGFLWVARVETFAGWLGASYRAQLELGLNLGVLQVGPTFDLETRESGWAASIGYGRVFGVAGGGVR